MLLRRFEIIQASVFLIEFYVFQISIINLLIKFLRISLLAVLK